MSKHSQASWHGLRNLISGVIGVLDTVKHRSFEPEELARFLSPEKIDLMLEQLHLTHDLMTSELRIEKAGHQPVTDLKFLMEQVFTILSHHKKSVGVQFSFKNDLDNDVSVQLTNYQMQDVVSNLIVNAFEAFPEKELNYRVVCECFNDDETVTIEVKNNGPAISMAQSKSIFLSGFTTKSDGEGMGLADTKRSIEQACGEISIDSNDEFNVIFRVSLPRLKI